MKLSRLWKFRTTLGPVEQAQVVASVVVVVSLATIVSIRVFTYGKQLDWLLFGSVTTVGVLGFINVLFTLKYGQQLEEQKRELMALNTIAEAVNRSVGLKILLQESIREVRRLLDVDYGWIYHLEGGRLILRAAEGAGPVPLTIIEPDKDIEDKDIQWVRLPRSKMKPRRWESKEEWTYGGIGSWASVPIIMKDKFAGAIVVASIERKAILQKQLNLMGAFSNQIGVALENATLFEQLRKSEERYMDLFEHSPDMYQIVNRGGIIVSCNQTEADRLGYRKDELVGHSVLTFYPPESHAAVQSLIKDVFENSREVSGHEQQVVTKTGEVVDVSVSTSILYDESRKPAFIRIVARDITEKKKLESKIFHAQRIDSIGNLAGGIPEQCINVFKAPGETCGGAFAAGQYLPLVIHDPNRDLCSSDIDRTSHSSSPSCRFQRYAA